MDRNASAGFDSMGEPSADAPHRITFGVFELDLRSGELRKSGTRLNLQQQPLQLLSVLLEHPGELITRDELRKRLWPEDTFVDFEHGLNAAVKRLRDVLGDSADSPRFVETVPRRGYRFVAPASIPNDAPLPAARTAAPRWRWSAWITGVAAAGALGFGLRALQRGSMDVSLPAQGSSATSAASHEGDLAVLPLQVLTPIDPALEYLRIGIPDTIITRLAAIRSLRLRPTSAVIRFGKGSIDIRRAAEELRVKHVLTGTLRSQGNRYRLNLQLVRAADGAVVWARPYEIPSHDLASLQDDAVAEHVVRALSLTLTAAERERVHRRYTQNGAAYAEFLHGRSLLVEYTERRMLEAMGKFEAALARDPGYAVARASLAMALAWYSVRYVAEGNAGQWGARAEEQAMLALRQDPNLAEGHLALASAAGTAYRNFDWPRVLDETAVALSLDPNLHLAHTARARAFFHYGLFRGVEIETEAAAALAGGSSVEDDRMRFYAALHSGHFAQAVTLGEALQRRTDAVAIPTNLALALYYVGDKGRAFEGLRTAKRSGMPDLRAQAALASLEAAVGRHGTARALVGRILEQPYRDHHIAYSLAVTHAQLGQMDEAARWLTEAAKTGFPCYPWFIRDPLLEPLRNSAQFRQLEPGLRQTFEADSTRYGTSGSR